MNKIKTKLRRLRYSLRYDFFKLDNIILLVAFVFCAVWTWGAISSMSRNWELEQRLSARKRELALLRLEVETMALDNNYYRSEEYQELVARQEHNKALPGETLLFLPPNSQAARSKHQSSPIEQPARFSNFKQWMSFLFGV